VQDIRIPAARQTPEVDFRFSAHRLSLHGECYPENAAMFFAPLAKALVDYLAASGDAPVTFVFSLRYMNSASTKMIYNLIGFLNNEAGKGRKITLECACDPEDDVIAELADDMAADFTWLDVKVVELA
jgi:hypothetical protein